MKTFLAGVCLLIVCGIASLNATTMTFSTAAGSSLPSGSVNASAMFITTAGQVQITLNDLLANPTDVGQLISDLDFTLSGLTGTSTLTTSSGQEITINGNKTFTLGGAVSTGWGIGTFNGGLILCIICPTNASLTQNPTGQPSHEIIGPGPYSNSNGSIAGNGPHNPFLNQTAMFTISNSSITANTTISNVAFSFGTAAGANGITVAGVQAVPEPGSMSLLGAGLIGLAWLARKFRKA